MNNKKPKFASLPWITSIGVISSIITIFVFVTEINYLSEVVKYFSKPVILGSFPIELLKPPPSPPPGKIEPKTVGIRVYGDDNQIDRSFSQKLTQSLKSQFEQEGYKVHIAGTGNQGAFQNVVHGKISIALISEREIDEYGTKSLSYLVTLDLQFFEKTNKTPCTTDRITDTVFTTESDRDDRIVRQGFANILAKLGKDLSPMLCS